MEAILNFFKSVNSLLLFTIYLFVKFDIDNIIHVGAIMLNNHLQKWRPFWKVSHLKIFKI